MRLYMGEICEIASKELGAEHWPRRQRAAKCLSQLADGVGATLVPHLPILVAPLVDVLKGKLWDGKTDVVKALCAVLSACRGLWPDDSVHKPAELLSLLLSTLASLGCLRGSLPLLVLEPLVGLPDAAFPGLLCRRPARATLF